VGEEVTPGQALGSWAALGPPDCIIKTDPGLTGVQACLGVLLGAGAPIALLVACTFLRPWYAALILLLAVSTIALPIAGLVVWFSWKQVTSPSPYIYIAGDTVEMGCPAYRSPRGLQRIRFDLSGLLISETGSGRAFPIFSQQGVVFGQAIPITIEGSASERMSYFVSFPWPCVLLGLARFAEPLRLARIRQVQREQALAPPT
jgi:hypothetical protein